MLKNGEYAVIHTYSRLAGLTRLEYEDVVERCSGRRSSTKITHAQCDRLLASLEAILFQRYDEGLVRADLVPKVARMKRYHYRDRLPKTGMINSRLRFHIERLWNLMIDYLPPEDRHDVYLAAIMHVASGVDMHQIVGSDRKIIWSSVPTETARLTIEALKDRLKYAIQEPQEKTA